MDILSYSVGKLGKYIASMSFPRECTCDHTLPCYKKGCYADRGNFKTQSYINGLEKRWRYYQANKECYWSQLQTEIWFNRPRWFRYFVSGDIPDQYFVKKIFETAEKFPDTSFLIMTKKHKLINQYIKEELKGDAKSIPSNLNIYLSTWLGWKP